ncbi:MAG: hypothetical protein KAU62_15980 [Candidatus Heimdallarchaeota archaeon]|nr:hypothetical protein [Candidatus Heimdallarchaeota archaeon]MCK4612656.1 hypothetical protein [Candidatus Heimdallarchaeota archaeon]
MLMNEIERFIKKYESKINQAIENISEWELLLKHYRDLLGEQEPNYLLQEKMCNSNNGVVK